MPNAGEEFTTCSDGSFVCSFLLCDSMIESGDRAVRAMSYVYMNILVEDPFQVLVAFFQDRPVVQMVSGLDGSWHQSCVVAEFLWAGEASDVSDFGQDRHGAVIADSRDAGEQHGLLIVFAECFYLFGDLCFFMGECFDDVEIAVEGVSCGVREFDCFEELHSSDAEHIGERMVYAVHQNDSMDLVFVSGEFFSYRLSMSEETSLFHDLFGWDVRGSDEPGP